MPVQQEKVVVATVVERGRVILCATCISTLAIYDPLLLLLIAAVY